MKVCGSGHLYCPHQRNLSGHFFVTCGNLEDLLSIFTNLITIQEAKLHIIFLQCMSFKNHSEINTWQLK